MLAILTSHPIQYQAPLWRALAAAGVKFEVWFLTPHAVKASFDREFGKSFAWDVDLVAGYPHRFLPIADGWTMNRFNGVRLTTAWRDEFLTRKITHLWVEGWRFREFWSAIFAAKANGLHVALRGESNDLGPNRAFSGFLHKIILKSLFQRIDSFLCIGSANRRFYLRHGVPESRFINTPYGVDHAYFARAASIWKPERNALRANWGLREDAFVALFCGKLIPKKRPIDLVTAASSVRLPDSRNLQLLFAGDGELYTELSNALTKTRMVGTITGFLNQSEVPKAYAAADCLVLPSDHRETWGLVANEALAAGLDVIVSDLCGCAEDVALPLGKSHVFRCGNVHHLAECLTYCATNPSTPTSRKRIVETNNLQRTAESVKRHIFNND